MSKIYLLNTETYASYGDIVMLFTDGITEATAVPEPSTLALLWLGLSSLFVGRETRREIHRITGIGWRW